MKIKAILLGGLFVFGIAFTSCKKCGTCTTYDLNGDEIDSEEYCGTAYKTQKSIDDGSTYKCVDD